MKSSVLFLMLLLMPFLRAQVGSAATGDKNELRANLLYLIEGTAEITYERLAEERLGLGASTYVVLRKGGMKFFGDSYPWNFSIHPFARFYFGKPRGKGFFLEGNLMLGADTQALPDTGYRGNTEWGFGLGMAYGGKWVLGNNWVAEVYVGFGYTDLWDTPDEGYLFDDLFDNWVYPRFGINIGKRF